MTSLAQDPHGVTSAKRVGGGWLSIAVAVLVVGAAGCTQTMTSPPVSEADLAGPLVLNSAPGAATVPDAATVAPPPAAVTTTAVSTTQPTALQPESPPATASSATADEGQFPNINKPPGQPGGTLLAPDARAQIIADLEKLRAGQPTGGGGGEGEPSALADRAATHGQAAIRQIEECSQDGALENNPDCAPGD